VIHFCAILTAFVAAYIDAISASSFDYGLNFNVWRVV